MTNCMFKVTNHLIKIYKRLNTVWPKWRQLSWINFGGGTRLSSRSIAHSCGTWTVPAFLMQCESFRWLLCSLVQKRPQSSWKVETILLRQCLNTQLPWIVNVVSSVWEKWSSILRANSSTFDELWFFIAYTDQWKLQSSFMKRLSSFYCRKVRVAIAFTN